jgi:hypothetical protein
MRRRQQPLHQLLVRPRRLIPHERVHLGRRGNPIRSKLTRRISVTRSASAAGARPSFSSRASTNRSIGFRTHFSSFTAGNAGRTGFTYAQCASIFAAPTDAESGQTAPSSIHRSIVATCAAGNGS